MLAEAARAMGQSIAAAGLELVYGGGHVGLMGVLADAALAAGGRVHGVIPRGMEDRELAHRGLTRLEVVEGMHQRKQRMADLADGFIALPGGLGTLDELCEILTWRQLGLHGKPVGLLNVQGFFTHFLSHLDHALQAGLLRPAHRAMLLVEAEPAPLLQRMALAQP